MHAETTRRSSRLSYKRGDLSRGIEIHSSPQPSTVGDDIVSFEAIVPPHGDGRRASRSIPSSRGQSSNPVTCAVSRSSGRCLPRGSHAGGPRCRRSKPTTTSLRRALDRSAEDLGALRIFDPDFPERVVVAAGAPWFMTVFGRDSLITSWMALIVDPDLALGVLQTLARFQGKDIDPRS